ncbi:MAG: amino acid racemase [Planctomycetota bacterium]
MATRHIGIVGASPEGTALFYRAIHRHAQRLLPVHQHPVVSLHNERLADYIDAIHQHDWHAVGNLLRRSAEVMARAGADFCVTPDQAVLHGLHLAQAGSPIPWLSTTNLVAAAISGAGQTCVGLIGTKLVTQASSYQTHLGLRGIRVEVPSEFECDALETIIYDELIYGHFKPESQLTVLRVVKSLAGRGCEGVILGCSEAPMVVTAENSPIRVYDAVDILAEGTVRLAASTEPLKQGVI